MNRIIGSFTADPKIDVAEYAQRDAEAAKTAYTAAKVNAMRESYAAHEAAGGYLGKAWTKGGEILGAPKAAAMRGTKFALIGGLVAGGALVLNSMGVLGGAKKGKDSARMDADEENRQDMAARSGILTADQLLPPPETMMGEHPQPGELANKVRPNGPVQLGMDNKRPGEPHFGLSA